MSNVAITTAVLPMSRLGTDGELILDGGGGRRATPAEEQVLGVGPAHLERRPTVLPYRYQDAYGRDIEDTQQRVAVLDNGRLRATFGLDQGGRLLSLVDLETQREVLHRPDAIQFANLALRNAWFAGGVEWNLGTTGHWGLTAEPVAAGTVGDGVLRMWAYERLLGVTWRLDAWLPDGSDSLFTHVLIENPTDADLPVYWWSNIAVPQTEDTRVVVAADRALHFGYAKSLSEVPFPVRDGVDVSWPARHAGSADYFCITAGEHPWIAAVDGDGVGLGQASTSRLMGRKVFTWGGSPGGVTWQKWLSGRRSYAEIQAGLARTQLEHLRLPAGESWRFTESYRPIRIDGGNGDWDVAVAAAARAAVDEESLDRAHEHLTALEAAPVHEHPLRGGVDALGWGALEVAAGHRGFDPATPFDPELLSAEQQAWLDLARTGAASPALQRSAAVGPQWEAHLEAAEPGWLRDLLLGHAEHAAGNTERAREHWRSSADAYASPDAWRALALTAPDGASRARDLVRAHELDRSRTGLAIEALTALLEGSHAAEALALLDGLADDAREHPRIAYLECLALIRVGDAAGAARLLEAPLVLPDLREGEVGLDRLWEEFQRLVGTDEPLPAHYDFRMSSRLDGG
ncbi:DUF5107 domain-containing protein [Occultella gossypii]|uniref:DUF5107 domain-containing protein n=1 Tax=Occultella gossypii TaxID=2800820 RepID=A0ABS7SD62_9MICO|nr:DUF5107 domain-containing protein [Occultella gossypii]MBZ2197186.1 DUF5107 domain-containing protein [Occultella gossypii]